MLLPNDFFVILGCPQGLFSKIIKILINQYKRSTCQYIIILPLIQEAHGMYYDGRNPITVVLSEASYGDAAVGVACLAWLAPIKVFSRPFLFSLMCIGFVKTLKI